MAAIIEKIVIVDKEGQEISPRHFSIEANEIVEVKVIYTPETPEALKGFARWIIKPKNDVPYSSAAQDSGRGDTRGISVIPKFCGPKAHVIEAFVGEPNNSYPTQLTFFAYAPQKIVSTKWSRTRGGNDLRNIPIRYGDDVYLYVDTEGMNGGKYDIDIHVIRGGFKNDNVVQRFRGITCHQGEINLKINSTHSWRSGTGMWTSNGEQFYIKIYPTGVLKTIKDVYGDDEHARFLEFEDEISSTGVELHQEERPATVGKSEVNVERYELCRFTKIEIIDKVTSQYAEQAANEEEAVVLFKEDTTVLFEEGALQISTNNKTEFQVSEMIHFDYDSAELLQDAKNKLDGIADLLLDNPYVSSELGAHCDIRGTDIYNDKLSNLRAASAVEYLVGKGVSKKLLSARGYGKRRLFIEGEELTPEQHRLNRRVTIRFKIFGGDAQSLVFATTAPDKERKKSIKFNIGNYNTDKCLRRGTSLQHDTDIRILEVTAKGKNGPFSYDGTSAVIHEVYSDMSGVRTLPLEYLWPSSSKTNDFWVYINSCRYYSDKEKATVIVKVYPDIVWELALEFLIGVSNYRAVNMPPGPVYARHQEQSRKAGYERWLMRKQGKVPITIGFQLNAFWNDKTNSQAFTVSFKTKIELLAEKISKGADIVQKVVNTARGVAAQTALPIGFNIRYPIFMVVGSWFLKPAKDDIIVAGRTGFAFRPLIGAEARIDLVAAVIAAASYGTTGNPAVARIINKLRERAEQLGASITFDVLFFGELRLAVDGLIIDSKNGIDMSGRTVIQGRFGIEVMLTVGLELGKANGITTEPLVSFDAELKGQAYFGGTLELNSDEKGLYVKPIIRFSGLTILGEAQGRVGWLKSPRHNFRETILGEKTESLGKSYII